jgi:hypothetical protein
LRQPKKAAAPSKALPQPASVTAAPGWKVSRPPRDPFKPPAFEVVIPPNLGHKPTSQDVRVKKGFDGLTPSQVTSAVVSHLKSPLADINRTFVTAHIPQIHKAFTMAVNNLFVAGSPNKAFIDGVLARHDITVLGSMTSSQPAVIKATRPGIAAPLYYAKDARGEFVQVPEPRFVVMSAAIRRSPAGVAVTYPDWTCAALSGPTGSVTEL